MRFTKKTTTAVKLMFQFASATTANMKKMHVLFVGFFFLRV